MIAFGSAFLGAIGGVVGAKIWPEAPAPVLGLVALAAAGLGALIARTASAALLKPICELRKALERAASNKLDYRIEHRRPDELGELGELMESYNRMAESLSQSRQRQRQREDALKANNQQLAEASKAAEASVRNKTEHLAKMSHEIRTPINGIIGLTDILIESSQDAEQTKLLETISSSGNALMSLVNDILDFSKIEVDKLELCPIPLNLREFLDDLVLFYQPLAAKKEIELRIATADRIPDYLMCDGFRLRQVITNLLSNAIKFTKAGYVSLEARVLTMTDCEATVKFSVRDTGIGIDDQGRAKLFQAFAQAESSTARDFGGSGLGLAISQSIIEKMGSKIGLESKGGKGSCFSFVLKLRTPNEDELPKESKSKPADGLDGCLDGYTALLADDSQVNRLTFDLQIKKLGCELDLVANGQEALDAIQLKTYDFVLMDVSMPVMDGLEAARRIRQYELEAGAKSVPIIALTANVFSEQKDLCLAAGMDDFLPKPVKRETIAEKALLWIGFANGGRDAKISVSNKSKPKKKPAEEPPKPIEAMPPETAIDFAFLDNLDSIYGEGVAPEILREFLKEGRKSFDSFVSACDSQDPKRIAETAHKLKGEAGIVGYHDLAQELNKLKSPAAVSEQLASIPAKATEIGRSFEGLCAAIQVRVGEN